MNCNDTSPKAIGERIRTAREKLNMKQEDLASKLFCKREVVSYYENGNRDIKTDTLIRLSEILGVTTDYLLGLSKAETKDIEVASICDYTGLSEKSIFELKQLSNKNYLSIVDRIITSTEFLYLLDCIDNYKTAQKQYSDFINAFEKVEPIECDIDMEDLECSSTVKSSSPFENKKLCDLYMFRVQEAFRRIIEKDGVKNG